MTGKSTAERKRRSGFRYTYLLVWLIALPLLHVFFKDSPVGRWVISLCLLAVLFSGIRAVRGGRAVYRAAMLLAVPGAVLLVSGNFLASETVGSVRSGAVALFMVFVAGTILRDVLEAEDVTSNEIQGAISVYILVGIAFAEVFSIISWLDPGAYSFAAADLPLSPAGAGLVPGLLYFSFVTMTTLGYGDITPVSDLARTLAWMEAAFGQFYIAVLVARLVSLHIAHARD